MSAAEPQSPCISICVLDEQGICQGCFRSADEVTQTVVQAKAPAGTWAVLPVIGSAQGVLPRLAYL